MDEAKGVLARTLLRALFDNDVREFEALLEQGADPNYPVDLPSEGWRKELGLFKPVPVIVIAAMHADQRYLRGCLSHGGDPSTATEEKNGSAVVQSMWADRFDNTVALIRAGADLNSPVYDGHTLLDEAILVNRFKIASIMVEAGASPRLAKDGGGAIRRKWCRKVNYTEQAKEERRRLAELLEAKGFSLKCDP